MTYDPPVAQREGRRLDVSEKVTYRAAIWSNGVATVGAATFLAVRGLLGPAGAWLTVWVFRVYGVTLVTGLLLLRAAGTPWRRMYRWPFRAPSPKSYDNPPGLARAKEMVEAGDRIQAMRE